MATSDRFVGRRQVIRTTGLAAAGAGVALACSSDKGGEGGTQSAAGTAAGTAAAKTPKRGGTLTVDAGEVNPNTLVFQWAAGNVYLRWGTWDQLIYLDHESKIRPMLAETFEMRPDFTGVHVRLRPGVEFHSGRRLTAEDVKFTIEAFTADNVVSQAKAAMKAIKEITIADERTLDISWGEPRPMYEDYFAMIPILDKDTVAQAAQMKTLVGTGPFKFVSYMPQQGYVMERNSNYWDQGKPYVDRVQGRIYADDEARALALQSGELMHHAQPSYAMVKKLRGKKEITILDSGEAGNSLLGLVVTYPPLRDVRVRQALTLAIDRERIANEWAEGLVKPRNLPWPRGSLADIAEDEALLKYDPERAKSLLKQAGAEGFTLPTDTHGGIVDLLPYVQDMLKAVGVNHQYNVLEQSAYSDKHRLMRIEASWGPQHIVGFNSLHPAFVLNTAAITTVPNVSHYDTPEYRALLQKIVAIDPRTPEGKATLSQWNRRFLIDDPWLVPLCPVTLFDAMRREVQIAPTGRGPGKRVALSDVWIDA